MPRGAGTSKAPSCDAGVTGPLMASPALLGILAGTHHAPRARRGGRPRHRGAARALPEGRGLPGGCPGQREGGARSHPGRGLSAPGPRPTAPGHGRPHAVRRGPARQADPRRAGRDADRPRGRVGPDRGPGDGRGRLRGEAFQPERAGGPGARALPPDRAPRRGRAAPRLRPPRGGPYPPHRALGGAAGPSDGQGVRPAGSTPRGARPRALPAGPARGRVGLFLRGGNPHRGRPRAAAAREDPRSCSAHRDREVPRLPPHRGRGGRETVTLGLRARMVVTAATATAGALLAVHFLAEPGLRGRTLAETRTTLFAEARLMARVVEEGLARAPPPPGRAPAGGR